jgi:L-ascorbate metabolism protein UlaG (beta-lactamase superfamily)
MILLIILFLIILAAVLFFSLPSFGALPKGDRLARIKKSPNYRENKFLNISETPMMTKDASFFKIMWGFLKPQEGTIPAKPIPALKTDLNIPTKKTQITWFGHSSYLLQTQGKNILVDPVFSQRTSPIQWIGTKAFPGTDIYGIDDLPQIDIVLLTHDHYDHLDYHFIKQFKNRKNTLYITNLGVGAHLEKWGVEKDKIKELDWGQETQISENIKLIAASARHFSGRNLWGRNQSLWSSFIMISAEHKIYIGGDSGYDKHFAEIGEKYGPFDLAILECGQYNHFWPYIHMLPEQTAQAAKEIGAKVLLPVHWAKFKLSTHPWAEPIKRVLAKAKEINQDITTPRIGESIIIDEFYPQTKWWEGI